MGEAFRGQRQHQLPLPLPDYLGLEAALHVPGRFHLDRPNIGQRGPGPGPIAAVAGVPADRLVLPVAEVIADPALQGGITCSSNERDVSDLDPLKESSLH